MERRDFLKFLGASLTLAAVPIGTGEILKAIPAAPEVPAFTASKWIKHEEWLQLQAFMKAREYQLLFGKAKEAKEIEEYIKDNFDEKELKSKAITHVINIQ